MQALFEQGFGFGRVVRDVRPFLCLMALWFLVACDDQVMVEQPNSFHSDVRSVAVYARGEGDIYGAESVGSP